MNIMKLYEVLKDVPLYFRVHLQEDGDDKTAVKVI